MDIQVNSDGLYCAKVFVPNGIGSFDHAAAFALKVVEMYFESDTSAKLQYSPDRGPARVMCSPTNDYIVTVPLEEAKEETPATTREEKIQYLGKSGFVAETKSGRYVKFVHYFNGKRYMKGKGFVDAVASEEFKCDAAPDGSKDHQWFRTGQVFVEQWSLLSDQVIDRFYQEAIAARQEV